VAASVSCPLWSRGRANDLCWSATNVSRYDQASD
jgi:hypothetical protein